MFSVVSGGSYHFYTPHEDGVLAYSARGVLVVMPGPCDSLGLCSKSWGGVPKVGMVFQILQQNPHPVLLRSGCGPVACWGRVPNVWALFQKLGRFPGCKALISVS